MPESELVSIDLHLDHPPGEVVSTEELIEVNAGINPVYYQQRKDEVLASTSLTELVFELGSFERNREVTPPNYFENGDRKTLLDRVFPYVPDGLTSAVPRSLTVYLKRMGLFEADSEWSETTGTVDSRIGVLQPFERVTPEERVREFEPTHSMTDAAEFVERSAEEIEAFVHSIERRYPDHEQIIRVGGGDSQLIALVPKLTDNWHVFTAEPNHWIVDRFLFENGIEVGEFFHHDNRNEETWRDFRRKLICGDIRAHPKHQRWYPTLEGITDRFDGDCIFWIGTEGDALNRYYGDFHEGDRYFDRHFNRVANWQGLTHQVTKNYTGAAALSPYHSESIWRNLYRHYDTDMLSPGEDLRPRIADQWYSEDVWWPDRNPSPEPYQYPFEHDYRPIYFDYISERLDGRAESVIS